jgi:hypothetical protein
MKKPYSPRIKKERKPKILVLHPYGIQEASFTSPRKRNVRVYSPKKPLVSPLRTTKKTSPMVKTTELKSVHTGVTSSWILSGNGWGEYSKLKKIDL